MRIVQITENYPPNHLGGAEVSCQLITNELRKRGHDVFVITNSIDVDKQSKDVIYLNTGCYWGCRDQKKLLMNHHDLKQIVETLKPDVVHVHLFERHLQGALMLARDFPLLYTAHNYTLKLPQYLSVFDLLKNPRNCFSNQMLVYFKHLLLRDTAYIRTMITNQLPFLKKVVCPSEFMNRTLQGVLKRDQLETVYNGVADMYFKKKVVNTPSKILYVGRIEKYKGIDYILKSVKQSVRQRQNIEAVLVGTGTYERKIKKRIVDWGLGALVSITPFTSEVDYSLFDGVLIYPSIWEENCSMTILEALSAGKIVISTARGGNGELIEDLYNGFVINSKNYNAITKKLSILREYPSLVRFFSHNARKSFLEKFQISKQVDRLEQIYAKL